MDVRVGQLRAQLSAYQLSRDLVTRHSSPTLPKQEVEPLSFLSNRPPLLYCPGEVGGVPRVAANEGQGHEPEELFHAAQARDRSSSTQCSINIFSGTNPAQPSPGTSKWPLVLRQASEITQTPVAAGLWTQTLRLAVYRARTSAWPPVAAQATDTQMRFSGNTGHSHQHRPQMLYHHGPRCSPWWQPRHRHHLDLTWLCRLFISAYSSLPLHLQFQHFPQCANSSASLTLHYK